jgi:ferredoxin
MNRIYWFSGTGNTLKLAQDFAEALGGAELIPISSLPQQEHTLEGDTIGIFFPVYCFGVPRIVSRFLLRAKAKDGAKPYIYAVSSSAGMSFAAMRMTSELLAKRGLKLSAGFSFRLPGNYIAMYEAPKASKQLKEFEKAAAKLPKAVEAIITRRELKPEGSFFPLDLIAKFVARRAIACLPAADRWFWVDNKCDCCGLCAKICPVSNIELDGGRPKWKRNCEQCMACLQWCPKEAIQFRNASANRKRYRREGVTPAMLIPKGR